MPIFGIDPPPSTGGGGGGGGPEPGPGSARAVLRSEGLLTLAVGFALGITFMLLFWFVRTYGAPTGVVADFVAQVNPNLWFSFLSGFVGGTVVSAIYNILVVHRINLFGLESNAD